MIITDGRKTVNIEIRRWNGSGYDPDWSQDYFDGARRVADIDAYAVDDVDYCIEFAQAADAEGACCKWDEDTQDYVRDEDMVVFVEELPTLPLPEVF